MEISRNQPCPCGSGKKYKRCCMGKGSLVSACVAGGSLPADEGDDVPEGMRVIEHRGRRLITRGDPDERALDVAAEFFERRERGEGPAADMVRFAEPLLKEAGDDADSYQGALNLAMMFWNLAQVDDEEGREDLMAMMTGPEGPCRTEEDRQYMWALAGPMIERHKAMFPGLHRAQAR